MKMNDNKKQMQPDQIKEAAEQILRTEFWYCSQFADVLHRFLEITVKRDDAVTLQLQGPAMYFLTLEGGKMTHTQLAKKMLRSKDGITKIVNSLEKEGWVSRGYTKKDRRLIYIKMTPEGYDFLIQKMKQGNLRAEQVMTCLDIEERKTLVELVEKMRVKMISILEEN